MGHLLVCTESACARIARVGRRFYGRQFGSRRSFGSVRKLHSGRWQALDTHPETGTRVAGPTTFTAKADGTRWLSTVDDRLIRENPCRLKGAVTEHSRERQIPTLDEGAHLADAIAPRFRAMVLLAAVGARAGAGYPSPGNG